MKCEPLIPQSKDFSGLTVGTEFHLDCREVPPNLQNNDVRFQVPDPGLLHVLKIKKVEQADAGHWIFRVQSFQVGQHRLTNVTLTDGITVVPIEPLEFTVQSVFQPQEEKAPVGLTSPMSLALHGGLIVALILALVAVGWTLWRARGERKKELKRRAFLETLTSNLTPQMQAVKSLQKLKTRFQASELVEVLEKFCFRELRAMDRKEVLARLDKKQRRDLKDLLSDLEGLPRESKISAEEQDRIWQRAFRFVDELIPTKETKSREVR